MVIAMFRVCFGSAALSGFRLEKLRKALKTAAPGVVLADTRHIYFIALREGGSNVSDQTSTFPLQVAHGAS